MAKRVIQWNSDRGVAPDGTRYVISSEQERGEARMYWAELIGSKGYPVRTLSHPTDPWAYSLDKAKQAAEAHYAAKQASQDAQP